ncbi:MAG: ATP-binding cassette domain-containing protein [Oscillospiraceae bacterium]|nr:ATP-binding cassette domain-containing protein [Oscillospiraceae bacterium]
MAKQNRAILHATMEIMEQLLETDDVYEVLARALDIIVSHVKCEAAVVWIADGKQERLYPLFHRGPSDITGVSVRNGSGSEGKCVTEGVTVLLNQADQAGSAEGSVYDGSGFRTRSVMCLPLKVLNRTYGCFQIINKIDGSDFEEQERVLCERLAAIAALAIDDMGVELEIPEKKNVLISLKGVTKEFASDAGVVHVLNGIDLDIYENEFVVVLGESGCGKSTMLNIIGGMDQLTGGTLLIEGNDYSAPSEKDLTDYRRLKLGFIFQSYNLMPNLTARENLQFIAELVPSPLPVDTALEKVGMLHRADNYPAQLSGGQQQRIAIARALVKQPKVILADEPTAALDLETSLEVLGAIESIVRSKTATVIMVTHNPEIGKMADRIIRIRTGKVASIKTNPNPVHASELSW